MRRPKITTDTVKVSRLGCMRKSTLVHDDRDHTVEHVELWTESDPPATTPGKPGAGPAPERRR